MTTSRLATFAVAALFAAAALPAYAMTNGQIDGYEKCVTWCMAHNKTEASQYHCKLGCDIYWSSHKSLVPMASRL